MFLNLISRWKTKRYIAVSNFIKKELVDGGVASRKVKVVYNGVAEIPSSVKKREESVVIGTIGRLHHIKGYHRLVDAIEILRDEPIKVELWGEGEDRELIENMIKVKELSGVIELKGFADNILKALEGMDIFVQPSRMEGFGLTVVEAMMAEKPVLVTPGGSLPEIVKDGETGVVTNGFEPEAIAAGLKVLIENQKFASSVAKAARKEAVAKFNVQKFAEETVAVFLEVA
jgi:glycosyltransferase involved in cell wall biosynthesis